MDGLNRSVPEWWDPYSDQPYRLPAESRPAAGADVLLEYLKTAATALAYTPAVAARFLALRPARDKPSPRDMAGLSISPNHRFLEDTVEMVAELGVRHLLVRIPLWAIENIGAYRDLVRMFPDQDFVVNILQDRRAVTDRRYWSDGLHRIFEELSPSVRTFQIGNAVNRKKWGCYHVGEYLDLMDQASEVAGNYRQVRLLGSSVIDFEPMATLRTLINFHPHRIFACASQLYVNRRGSPGSRQFGVFDLYNKLRLIYSILCLSRNSDRRLWITETNWPLLATRPYTPNSGHPRSTVDETTQAEYLTEYFRTCRATGWVERAYWWQLINPGYGLVDHRGGVLRKMPSYDAFKAFLSS